MQVYFILNLSYDFEIENSQHILICISFYFKKTYTVLPCITSWMEKEVCDKKFTESQNKNNSPSSRQGGKREQNNTNHLGERKT
jgi:hypothetical protein